MNEELEASARGGGDGGGDIVYPWKQGMLKGIRDIGLLPIPFDPQVMFLLSDLVGRKLRVSTGVVTMEIDPGRVTILVEEGTNRIMDIWVDPDLPRE